jgi:hypothetical protein
MTLDQITIAVAELDGWKKDNSAKSCHPKGAVWSDPHNECRTYDCEENEFPNVWKAYLTSRDAIIPVIEKQTITFKDTTIFITELTKAVGWNDNIQESVIHHTWAWYLIKATPLQLCTALLKATGKWKDL